MILHTLWPWIRDDSGMPLPLALTLGSAYASDIWYVRNFSYLTPCLPANGNIFLRLRLQGLYFLLMCQDTFGPSVSSMLRDKKGQATSLFLAQLLESSLPPIFLHCFPAATKRFHSIRGPSFPPSHSSKSWTPKKWQYGASSFLNSPWTRCNLNLQKQPFS